MLHSVVTYHLSKPHDSHTSLSKDQTDPIPSHALIISHCCPINTNKRHQRIYSLYQKVNPATTSSPSPCHHQSLQLLHRGKPLPISTSPRPTSTFTHPFPCLNSISNHRRSVSVLPRPIPPSLPDLPHIFRLLNRDVVRVQGPSVFFDEEACDGVGDGNGASSTEDDEEDYNLGGVDGGHWLFIR